MVNYNKNPPPPQVSPVPCPRNAGVVFCDGEGGGEEGVGQERSSKPIKLAWKVVMKPDRVLKKKPSRGGT